MAVASDDFAGSVLLPMDPRFLRAVSELARLHDLTSDDLLRRVGTLLLARYGPGHGDNPLPDADTSVRCWLAESAQENGKESSRPLPLAVTLGVDGRSVQFVYESDVFDSQAAERMTGHFATLLTSLIADPPPASAHWTCSPKPSDTRSWWTGTTPRRGIRTTRWCISCSPSRQSALRRLPRSSLVSYLCLPGVERESEPTGSPLGSLGVAPGAWWRSTWNPAWRWSSHCLAC